MSETDSHLNQLKSVLLSLEDDLIDHDLRNRVLAIIPAYDHLRELGKSLIPDGLKISARDRLLKYFLEYPRVVINEKELLVVAGIGEWARRVRELRVEFGWRIITGLTAKEMVSEEEMEDLDFNPSLLRPTDYILLTTKQDRDSVIRWNIAKSIRNGSGGAKSKVLKYLQENIGFPVSGEELRYVANSSEWARRIRELRTEDGWPITTKMSGNPQLEVGMYVLELDRQLPPHDRKISDSVRRKSLQRDGYECRECGWTYSLWNPSDPRFLELHHKVRHVDGGVNEADNLMTLCNVCHDEVHKLDS